MTISLHRKHAHRPSQSWTPLRSTWLVLHAACRTLLLFIVIWIAPAACAEVRDVPPLPRTAGSEVVVSDAGRLKETIENVPDNTTILIADGTYRPGKFIYLRARRTW